MQTCNRRGIQPVDFRPGHWNRACCRNRGIATCSAPASSRMRQSQNAGSKHACTFSCWSTHHDTCKPVPSEVQVRELREVAPVLGQCACTDKCVCHLLIRRHARAHVCMRALVVNLSHKSPACLLYLQWTSSPKGTCMPPAAAAFAGPAGPAHAPERCRTCQPVVAEVKVREPHHAVPAAWQRSCGTGMSCGCGARGNRRHWRRA